MSDYDYADKIAKLLRKAEATSFPEERDSLVAKAQHLMTVYAIDEAMLADRKPDEREPIENTEVMYTGVYAMQFWNIGAAVAKANGCRVLFTNVTYGANKGKRLTIIGFKSDIARARLLDTSLQLQATQALKVEGKDVVQSWMSAMEKFKSRRTFLDGFCSAVTLKLHQANREAKDEVVKTRADEAGTTVEDASTEVGLVLRSRKDQVDDWIDNTYGKLGKARVGRYQSGSASAYGAGREAGSRADVGQSRLGNKRGELNG